MFIPKILNISSVYPIVQGTASTKEHSLAEQLNTGGLKRRQPKQHRSDATKAAVIAAATQLLGEEGFAAFSIRAVAKLAKVSVGTIYEYFPTKQALLFWVVEKRLQMRVEALDEVLEATGSSAATLYEIIERFIDSLARAGLYSKLDLEIRAAEEWDSKLSEYTKFYKQELTRRYISLWQQYGAKTSKNNLECLAEYAHQLDTVSMRMQLQYPKKQLTIRRLNRQFVHALAYAGLENPSK